MTYFTIVYSSWVVNSGQYSGYIRFWSHQHVNTRNREVHSINCSGHFQLVFTSIIGSTAIRMLACWQEMNSFRWPCVSVINTSSIHCYMKVSFRTFNISWNLYFLNYLCQTHCHGRQLIDWSIALFSKSLTVANVYAFNQAKLLIVLMRLSIFRATLYTETAHECTESQLYDVCHARYLVPQCRPLGSRGLKWCSQRVCHRVNRGSVICQNTKGNATVELKMIPHILQTDG